MKLRLFGTKGDEGHFNPEEFCVKKVDPAVGEYYEITPGEFYPKMVAWVRTAAAHEELPPELVDSVIKAEVDPLLAARRYKAYAKRIPDISWSDALVPVNIIAATTQERLSARADALELCRLWFTRAMKNQAGGPIKIHILKDERFALGVPYPGLPAKLIG